MDEQDNIQTIQIFTWDSGEVPPFEEMAQFATKIREVNGGLVYSAMFETESDEYGCWIADRELTDSEARDFYYEDAEDAIAESGGLIEDNMVEVGITRNDQDVTDLATARDAVETLIGPDRLVEFGHGNASFLVGFLPGELAELQTNGHFGRENDEYEITAEWP